MRLLLIRVKVLMTLLSLIIRLILNLFLFNLNIKVNLIQESLESLRMACWIF